MTAMKMKRPKVTTRLSRLCAEELAARLHVDRDAGHELAGLRLVVEGEAEGLDAVVEVVAQVVGDVLREVLAHVVLAVSEDAADGVESR